MFPDDSEWLEITGRVRVSCREFQWTVARSSGPGGQNVNKVNSKVAMRWDFALNQTLSDDVKARFITAFGRRLTTVGELIISSERFRDQPKNVVDCLDKLREMLRAVAIAPKARKAVKPTRASKARRLSDKRERGVTKQRRQSPRLDD